MINKGNSENLTDSSVVPSWFNCFRGKYLHRQLRKSKYDMDGNTLEYGFLYITKINRPLLLKSKSGILMFVFVFISIFDYKHT